MTSKKVERRGDDCAPGRIGRCRSLTRALAFTVAVLMTIASISFGEPSVDHEKTVAALDTEYQAAVKNNDVAIMDRILADDFALVSGLGKSSTKPDVLHEVDSMRTA